LKLEYDEPLSNFAFKFNLRRYIVVVDNASDDPAEVVEELVQVNAWHWIGSTQFDFGIRATPRTDFGRFRTSRMGFGVILTLRRVCSGFRVALALRLYIRDNFAHTM
jgi:hypothetical protein